MDDKDRILYLKDSQFYNKTILIEDAPEPNIGIADENSFYDVIINSTRGVQEIESLTSTALDRDSIYLLIDTMAEDPTIAAALEIYAEDVTESNDLGLIVWATSSDAETSNYINFLLKLLRVDKYIYNWVYSLCKYGDCYIKLFKESEIDIENTNKKTTLNEDIKVNLLDTSSRFSTYLKLEKNPAIMFELTRYGKTELFIKADVNQYGKKQNVLGSSIYGLLYKFNSNDVLTYEPEAYVHGYLPAVGSRYTEEILLGEGENAISYEVTNGLSLLQNTFKIWRQILLLDNSLLLNRLTKSSIVRLIGVEVNDMPPDKVAYKLQQVKSLFELKSAINSGNSFDEYTNPGPIENIIYMPTRGGKGNITTTQIGGDVDVRGLADIDYFKNKEYSALKIPKLYLGDTDDATGFNGGTSLSIISSRYAKTVKRIQTATILMIEDLINRYLVDRELIKYIGRFTLHMQEPTTQEITDRQANMALNVSYVLDIMSLIDIQDDEVTRLNILKLLIDKLVPGTDIIALIDEYIENLNSNTEDSELSIDDSDVSDLGSDFSGSQRLPISPTAEPSMNIPDSEEGELEDIILPSPAELNSDIDFTDNNSTETEIEL